MEHDYKEVRILHSDNLRRLCIKQNWYTKGDNEEYQKLLDFADSLSNVTTDDIIKIAKDIIEHTAIKKYEVIPLEYVCFELIRTCYTYIR